MKIWQRKYLRVSVPLTKSFTVWPILHLVIVLGVKRALACGAQAGFPKARLQWGGIVPSLGAWPVTHSLIHPTLSPLILLLEVTGASSQHQTHYRRTGANTVLLLWWKLHCVAVCCFTRRHFQLSQGVWRHICWCGFGEPRRWAHILSPGLSEERRLLQPPFFVGWPVRQTVGNYSQLTRNHTGRPWLKELNRMPWPQNACREQPLHRERKPSSFTLGQNLTCEIATLWLKMPSWKAGAISICQPESFQAVALFSS